MWTGNPEQIKVCVDKPYNVIIGRNIKDYIIKFFSKERPFIVTDSNVFELHRNFIRTLSENIFIIDAGETSKNIGTLQKIYDFMINKGADRYSYLVAIGGGVVGDIGGFAASTYMRGVALVHVPTSLLAMVDSSIGGKTGINYGGYKNIIGSFYQPRAVFVSVDFLSTLPEREYISAFAEIVKYGVSLDREFFNFLENNVDALRAREFSVLKEVVKKSIENKVKIVEKDERESGLRAVLNFGHTFAHAIESITEYKYFLHGEAVSMGIVLAAKLSNKMGLIGSEDFKRIKNVLEKLGLPTEIDFEFDKSKFYEIMLKDKKNKNSSLRFVLTRGIGSSIITDDIVEDFVKEVIEANV